MMKTSQTPPLDVPLSDEEIEQLDAFLISASDYAMNVEELDGFFAALVAGPEMVPPSEYWPEIMGGDDFEYQSMEQAHEIALSIHRLWNTIAVTLQGEQPYIPIMLMNESEEVARGCDWAKGFMRGVSLRPDKWQMLLNDEDHAGAILPILMLAHEDDPNPELRPPSIPPDRREDVHVMVAAGLIGIYDYFEPLRRAQAMLDDDARTYRRDNEKIGRNDPCPCGSGKKYKKCCIRSEDQDLP